MRASLLLSLLVACSGVDGPDSDKTDPPVDDTVPATLEEAGELVCVSPDVRASEPYLRKTSNPYQPMEAANLSGGGMVVEDLDGDGIVDLFLPSDQITQMWWGTGDELFDEGAAAAFGTTDLSMGVGGTAADFDADGDLDLYVTRWNLPDRLLRNNGDRTFTDVTEAAGLGSHTSDPPVEMLPDVPWTPDDQATWAQRWRDRRLYTQSSSWADVDADGDLDLYVGTYGEFTILDVLDPVPDCSDHIADPSELWLNNGDGTFTDAADLLPDEVHIGYGFMSGFYDIDDDGFPELFTAHDDGVLCGSSVMVHNDGGTAFTVDTSSNFHPDAFDMGMGVGDLNGDELPDFLLTSWNGVYYMQSSESPLGDHGVLYVDWTEEVELNIDAASQLDPGSAQPGQQVYGWGAEFGDVDNDGDLDAAMGFGYWSFFDGAGDPLQQRDGLWLQDDAGRFSDQAPVLAMADPGITRSVVLADLNGDGWLDVIKRMLDERTPMYLSRCGSEAWVQVRTRAPGANTYAVGAKVRVTIGEKTQVRWIQSGSSGMYSGGPLVAHFGLGDAETIDTLEVVWPDGEVSRFEDVTPRQRLTITRE